MTKKKNRTRKEKQTTGVTRKTAVRKMKADPKVKAKAKAQAATPVKTTTSKTQSQMAVSMNRAEGHRLFKVAGRPSREDCIKVYGQAGPRLTWDQRAALGVPAEQFQHALASGKCVAPAPKVKAMVASAHLKAPTKRLTS